MPDLLKLLGDEKDSGVRLAAVYAVCRLSDDESQLVKLVDNKDPQISQPARSALIEKRIKSAQSSDLIKQIAANDENARLAAVELGKRKAKEVVPDLLKLLQQRDYTVPEVATQALIWLRAEGALPNCPREAVTEFLRSLRKNSFRSRMIAARALGYFGVTEAVPDLIRILRDEKPDIGSPFGGAAPPPDLRGPRKSEYDDPSYPLRSEIESVRAASAVTLGQLGAMESVPDLRKIVMKGAAPAAGSTCQCRAISRIGRPSSNRNRSKSTRRRASSPRRLASSAWSRPASRSSD